MHHHGSPLSPLFPLESKFAHDNINENLFPVHVSQLLNISCAPSHFSISLIDALSVESSSRLLRHLSDASEGRRRIDNVALWFWRRFLSTYLSCSTKGSPFTKNSYVPSLTHSLASTCLGEHAGL
jgi:hypothetical protein